MSCPACACSSAVSFAATSGWSINSPANAALCFAANASPIFATALSLSSLYELWDSRRIVAGAAVAAPGRRSRPVVAATPAPPAAVINFRRVILIDILLWTRSDTDGCKPSSVDPSWRLVASSHPP